MVVGGMGQTILEKGEGKRKQCAMLRPTILPFSFFVVVFLFLFSSFFFFILFSFVCVGC